MSVRPKRAHFVTLSRGRGVRRAVAVAATLATSAFGLVAFAPSAMAAPVTYTVNSGADVGDGTCDTTCTLRDAILNSNTSAGDHDTIQFAIGSGSVTISPTTPLPPISDPVTIDGSTQPGYAGSPIVYIDGTGATAMGGVNGLTLATGPNTIENLGIGGFSNRQFWIQNGDNVLVGNYIGTTATGTAVAPGGAFATIDLQNAAGSAINNNVIGGGAVGIRVMNSDQVAIGGNNIGVGPSGENIGSGGIGVYVAGTTRGANIRFNNIANNGGLGIDLEGNGPDTNDNLDGDAGPNNHQNYPVIGDIQQTTGTNIQGTLNSVASQAYHLDFFASTSCDPSGNGEGELYLGQGNVFTDASGDGAFAIGLDNPPAGYDFFTATATRDDSLPVGNETSEFSACHTVDGPTVTAPSAPTGVSAGAGDGGAVVSWNPPDSDGGSEIYRYTVDSIPSSPFLPMNVTSSATSATVAGLTNGTNYTFTVTATNNAELTSPASDPSNQVQPQSGAPDPESESTEFGAGGGTLSTGNDADAGDPTNTSVQSPNEGIVTIGESTLTGTPPAGVTYFGQQVDIDAPDATVNDPMKFTFVFDCSTLPAEVSTCPTPFAPFAPLAAPTAQSLAPTTASVNVNNGSYSPATSTVRQGGTVMWHFGGNRQHSVADTVGLAAGGGRLFNSGNRNPGATYSYSFAAAGQYKYRSFAPGDRASMKGTVSVPVDVSRDTAAPTDPVTVTWATSRPAGFRFDVQYRFKTPTGAYGAWKSFRSNSLMTSSSFTGAGLRGQGTYQFRSHLENMNTGRKSGWSDGAATVTVSTTTTGGSGQHIAEVAMFHDDGLGNNVQVPDCTGVDGVVQPGPACTWSETINDDGDLVVVVYTTHNNRWRGGKVATG